MGVPTMPRDFPVTCLPLALRYARLLTARGAPMRYGEANQSSPMSMAGIAEADGAWHDWTDNELDVLLVQQLGAEIHFDPKLMSGEMARRLMGLTARGTPLPN